MNTTTHTVHYQNANDLSNLEDQSVSLVVTSPPYPMIEMWDSSFAAQNPEIGEALKNDDAQYAFELMHRLLEMNNKTLK
jgi:DNA modification methylase